MRHLACTFVVSIGCSLGSATELFAQEGTGERFLARVEAERALASWRELHGANWRAFFDARTGRVEFLGGGNATPAFVPAEDDAFEDNDFADLARLAIDELEPMTGVEGATLTLDRVRLLPLGATGSTDKIAVRFRQELGGLAVFGGFANCLFDLDGRLLAFQSSALPRVAGFATRARLSADEAARAALSAFEQHTGLPGALVGVPRLGVARLELGRRIAPALVYEVDVLWRAPGVEPEGVRAWIDARDGGLRREQPLVHHLDVGGTLYSMASPGTAPDGAPNPPASIPVPYARVTSTFGAVFTDAQGNFFIPGAPIPTNATFEYFGTYADVDEDAGNDHIFAQQLFSTSSVVTMNSTPTQSVTSQANAFVHVARLRDWIRAVDPADDTADFQALARVNLQSTCNAYFDGSSVNFFASGGGCVNTAYSTVVAHEMGHWLNVLYDTGNGSDGMGEGNADVFAMYLYDVPEVGEDFLGPGTVIRTGLNSTQFCGDCCPGCNGGGVHREGEVWMGAAWKLREHLDATHGNVLGDAIADTLFSSWLNAYDQTQIKSVIELQWLALDDDNGNIDDGTPNYLDIDQGFRDQGFPGFDLPHILFEDVTLLPDTTDEVGPYAVDAELIPQSAPLILIASLYHRVAGGPWQSTTMLPTGNVFQASIPGQLSPTTVEYYVSATDTLNNTLTYPPLGPEAPLSFHVGVLHLLFADDFEGPDDGGWTHGTYGDTGNDHDDFQRGAPAGRGGDPDHAATGEAVFGNDLGQGAWNGLYQNNEHVWLRSPVIDASAAVNTRMRFQRWLTVEERTFDVARVLVGGVEIWSNDPVEETLDSEWVEQSFDLSAVADGNPALQVEFSLHSDQEGVYGGWNLDDFEITYLTPVGGGPVGTPYCFGDGSASACPCGNAGGPDEGCANSSGAGGQLTASGSTSVASDDLGFDAMQLLTNQPALLFSGQNAVNGGAGIAFGDGLRCAGGGVIRHGVRLPDAGGAASWGPGLGVQGGWQPGDTRRFQVWFRDPAGGPCAAGFNLTHGVEVAFTD